MTDLTQPLAFASGATMKNRFMLAPLTNCQSHADGTLSDDEYRWLTMRAEGGFGLTMTCAAHVQAIGQGFPGQLGIWDDKHIDGLTRLAEGIRKNDSIALVQLHHAGMRSTLVKDLLDGQPVCPSDNERDGARGLTNAETKQLIEDFIRGAERAQEAGFDGVEIHGAHGYILCQYFSDKINHRDDEYGGDLDGRFRILFEIIDGVRARCRKDFILGVRLSPERFGMKLAEVKEIAGRLLTDDRIDFLDMHEVDQLVRAEANLLGSAKNQNLIKVRETFEFEGTAFEGDAASTEFFEMRNGDWLETAATGLSNIPFAEEAAALTQSAVAGLIDFVAPETPDLFALA